MAAFPLLSWRSLGTAAQVARAAVLTGLVFAASPGLAAEITVALAGPRDLPEQRRVDIRISGALAAGEGGATLWCVCDVSDEAGAPGWACQGAILAESAGEAVARWSAFAERSGAPSYRCRVITASDPLRNPHGRSAMAQPEAEDAFAFAPPDTPLARLREVIARLQREEALPAPDSGPR